MCIRDRADAAGVGPVSVSFYKVSGTWTGCASGSEVSFNLQRLGKSWPDTASQEEVDSLLIHEFAHVDGHSDHYSSGFNNACCDIGAKLRQVTAKLR